MVPWDIGSRGSGHGTERHRYFLGEYTYDNQELIVLAFQQKMELPSSSEDEDYVNGNQPVLIGDESASQVSRAVSRVHRDIQMDNPEIELMKGCSFKFSPSGNTCGKLSGNYSMCPHHREQARLKSRRRRKRKKLAKLQLDNMSETTASVLSEDYMMKIITDQRRLVKSQKKLNEDIKSYEHDPMMKARFTDTFTHVSKKSQQMKEACQIISEKPELVEVLKSGSNVKEMTTELMALRRQAKRCPGTKHEHEEDKHFTVRRIRERLDYAETCDKRHQLMLYVVKELLDNYDVMCPHEKLFKEKPMFGEHPLNRCPNMCRELEGCPVPPPPSKLSRVRSVLPSWLGGNAPPQKRARE
jgi:hypothetical protein